MLWHNFKTRFLFELQTLPPSVAHGELAAPELQNLFPVCKLAPTNFGRKSVMPWIQKRTKAKKPNPRPRPDVLFATCFHSYLWVFLLSASLLNYLSLYRQLLPILVSFPTHVMPDTSHNVHKHHLSFIHMLLFHIVYFAQLLLYSIFLAVTVFCDCLRTAGPGTRDNFLLSVKNCENL